MTDDFWNSMDMTNDEFWQGLRDQHFILVDAPSRKVAVYPTTDGQVVMVIKDGEQEVITAFTVDDIGPLVSALILAKNEALPKDALINAQYDAYCAIEKARKSA